MHNLIRAIHAAPAPKPLRPDELVPDHVLRMFGTGEPEWQRGEISVEMQSMIVTAMADICGELLAYRAADRASSLSPKPRARTASFAIEAAQ